MSRGEEGEGKIGKKVMKGYVGGMNGDFICSFEGVVGV